MVIPVVVQTTPNAGLNSAELYVKEFTLTQNALVVVNYTLSMDFYSYDGTIAIDDGRSKMSHTYFYIGDGDTPDTTKAFGMTTAVYANADCDTTSGYVYNSQSVTIPLGPETTASICMVQCMVEMNRHKPPLEFSLVTEIIWTSMHCITNNQHKGCRN